MTPIQAVSPLTASDPNLLSVPAEPEASFSELGPGAVRPELQLLIACARTNIDPATREKIRTLLLGPLDWAFLLEKANRHCVAPLLCLNLNRVFPEALPAEILNDLRTYLHTRTLYNLYLTSELVRLAGLLEAQGVPTLPFKGPTLAALAYGSLGLRQFGDLDILVRKQDFTIARKILLGQGYRLAGTLTLLQRLALLSSGKKDLAFESADGAVRVELHWLLSGRHFSFPLNIDYVWEGVGGMPLAGSTVRQLSPADLLLFLCIHGSRHSWGRIGWIVDVAELINAQPNIDWVDLFERAESLGCARCLRFGLLLVVELLGHSLPPVVTERIRDESLGRALTATIQHHLFGELGDSLSLSETHLLSVRERFWDRVRLRVHNFHRRYRLYRRTAVTPNARDRGLLRLPRSLNFLYYFLRPVRLFGVYILKPPITFLRKTRNRDSSDAMRSITESDADQTRCGDEL